MAYPLTVRTFINFKNSNTGLTPTFTYWNNVQTPLFVDDVIPTIYPAVHGTYYFDYVFNMFNEYIYQVDGGSGITDETVRYVKGKLSPTSVFLDGKVSEIPVAVWSDTTSFSYLAKGYKVDSIGNPGDAKTASTLFGLTLRYKDWLMYGDASDTSSYNLCLNQLSRKVGSWLTDPNVTLHQRFDSLDSTKATTAGVASSFGDVTTQFGTVNSRLTTVTSMVNILANVVGSPVSATLSTDIAGVRSVAETLSTQVGDVQTKATAIRSDITGLGSQMTSDFVGVGSEIDSAKSIVSAVSSQVAGTQSSLTAVAAQVASVSAQVTGVQTSATGLTTRVGVPVGVSLAADVAAVASKLGAPVNGSVSADIAVLQTAVPSASAVANAVWSEVLSTHIAAGTGGDVLGRVFKILKNRTKIDTSTNTLIIFDDNGTTPLYTMVLKDSLGVPNSTLPFERTP